MKYQFRRAAFVVSALLCGAMPGLTPAQAETVSDPGLRAAAEKAATAYITGQLKDPDSARFKFTLSPAYGVVNMSGRRHSGYFLCGEVNGKNSYGGYTGFKPFIVIYSDATYRAASDGAIDSGNYSIVSGWCGQVYR